MPPRANVISAQKALEALDKAKRLQKSQDIEDTKQAIQEYAQELIDICQTAIPLAADRGHGYTRITTAAPPLPKDPHKAAAIKDNQRPDKSEVFWKRFLKVTLIQGPRGEDGALRPQDLPGGKTAVQVLQEALDPSYTVETLYNPKSRAVEIFVIWDQKEWDKKIQKINDFRPNPQRAPAPRPARELSLEEFQQRQQQLKDLRDQKLKAQAKA